MLPNANVAVDAVYRSDWGRIVATLIRQFGDFELAEDAAQDAFIAAVDQWPNEGVPESPRAWIIQTAKHKAIDRLRRQTRLQEKLEADPDFGSEPIVEGPNLDFEEIPESHLAEVENGHYQICKFVRNSHRDIGIDQSGNEGRVLPDRTFEDFNSGNLHGDRKRCN